MLLFLYNCNINHYILLILVSTTLDMRLTFSDTNLHSPKVDEFAKEVQSKDASIPANGTRWNPTEEQIQILEELYKGGMRTPNSKQIDEITEELGTYGRIEGKNVFYWFQNHKARERQRLKRSAAFLTLSSTTPDPLLSLFSGDKLGDVFLNFVNCSQKKESKKRKCREWEDESYETLNLFPLHPENFKRNY